MKKQDKTSTTTESTAVEQEKVGKFKAKRKLISFVTRVKGRIRILQDQAYIDASQFSKMTEGVVLKLSIYPNGTFDFEEHDSKVLTQETIGHFVEQLETSDVTGYANKFVISEFEFYDKDNTRCYLEVDHQKPFDALLSIFDNSPELSESGLDLLDQLFAEIGETTEEPRAEHEQTVLEETQPETVTEHKNSTQQYLQDSFDQMMKSRVDELKSRIDKTERELLTSESQLKQLETKITATKDDLRVLNTRLQSFDIKDSPVGWDFFISSEIKSDIQPDKNLQEVVEKISPLLGLKVEGVISLLTQSHYKIHIKSQTQEVTAPDKDIISKMFKIDTLGKCYQVSDCEFEYRGELNWHQLVDKMLRLGFTQNPEFDKHCGSNSYQSEEKQTQIDVNNSPRKKTKKDGKKN